MIGDILQPTHLIFILVVALLVLGPKRLPEVGRSLGKGIRDFRGAMSGIDEAVNPSDTSQQTPSTPSVISTGQSADITSAEPTFSSVEPPTVVHPEVATAPAFEESTPSVASSAAPAFAATHPTAPAMEFDMSSAFPARTASSAAGPAVASRSDAAPTTAVPQAGIHDPDPGEYAD